jgi:hypothetical protein
LFQSPREIVDLAKRLRRRRLKGKPAPGAVEAAVEDGPRKSKPAATDEI